MYFCIDVFCVKTKRRRSDSVLCQKPLHQQKKGKVTTQTTPQKSSIKQRLRTDLGRSVEVTTATQLVWLTGLWLSEWVKFLFNVTINDISVIYVTAHRCAGGLKKKLDLRSGSQRHRHFVGFFNVPVLAPTRDHPFYTVIPTHRPI